MSDNWRNESPEQCSERVASVAVDALLRPAIISREDFAKAVEIVTEEVNVRLCLGDYPPPQQKIVTPSIKRVRPWWKLW